MELAITSPYEYTMNDNDPYSKLDIISTEKDLGG